jgi:hypothetical protein
MTDQSSSLPLAQLSLRQRERGLVLGGTEAGKSTLADYLGSDFTQRYKSSGARRLVLDTKPRYRAQYLLSGMTAKRRYKSWDHGASIPGSILVEDPRDLERAFGMGNTVIVQGESGSDIPRVVACAADFLRHSRAGRPQLLQVDEVLDFYHSNGASKGGDDAITRSVRAGRERGTACLICSQRTKGIPPPIMEELSRCYLFRMDFKADAKRLQEMGAPEAMQPPTEQYDFRYWTKRAYGNVYGPYRLTGIRAA